MNRQSSSDLIARAQRSIPGGVNSPVRAFKGVGGDPIFFARGEGALVFDVDGNEYIDYVGSWGPMILGHAHRATVDAVVSQAQVALGFGAPTKGEIDIAEKIISLVPSIDQVRMVNSGTEATMSAIRLSRGFTGRDLILKFAGCYHGHSDSLLVKAGSGVLTLGIPNSPGVPEAVAANTLTAPFNDIDAVKQIFETYPGQIAGVIVEPVAGNMGCIPPAKGFLEGLRDITTADGSVLIFDEVMTGFRVHPQSAQGLYSVTPDLTTLGKIVGGGLPVGAFGGREDIMACIAPSGPVYQAGTLSGNPLAVAAGLATLNDLNSKVYEDIEKATNSFVEGMHERAASQNVKIATNHVCGMASVFFDVELVENFDHVSNSNVDKFNRFFHAMLDEGVYLAPSAFETGFVSASHSPEIINKTLDAAERAFATL